MGSPVAMWRQRLAYQVLVVHRVAMCGLFTAPLAVVLRLVGEEHPGAAVVASALTAAGFVGTLWFAPKLLTVSPRPARRGTARRALLRLYRLFVGNGDAMQGLARWIDPGWQNPYSGRTPHETACWLASVEVIHWALLAASVAPIAAALWYGHYVLGFVCVAATVLFNVGPNLVMRDTRQRLLRLSRRTPAAGTDTDRSGGDAAAPVPEVPSAVGPTGGPGAEPSRPHPSNASGPFYVEYGCCTACDVPMQEAPGMFKYDADNHCYVCRQPQTYTELTNMIVTAWMAELQCIRYRGSDSEILRRLAELDLRAICDNQPPAIITPVIRNHVQFAVCGPPPISSPQQLAKEFRDHLDSLRSENTHFVTTPIKISNDAASFEFSWYHCSFHPIVFHAMPGESAVWHIECPVKNELGDRGTVSVVFRWLKLNGARFTDVKWYSDSQWHGPKVGQATPW